MTLRDVVVLGAGDRRGRARRSSPASGVLLMRDALDRLHYAGAGGARRPCAAAAVRGAPRGWSLIGLKAIAARGDPARDRAGAHARHRAGHPRAGARAVTVLQIVAPARGRRGRHGDRRRPRPACARRSSPGIFGLSLAILFFVFGAPDVALSQIVVATVARAAHGAARAGQARRRSGRGRVSAARARSALGLVALPAWRWPRCSSWAVAGLPASATRAAAYARAEHAGRAATSATSTNTVGRHHVRPARVRHARRGAHPLRRRGRRVGAAARAARRGRERRRGGADGAAPGAGRRRRCARWAPRSSGRCSCSAPTSSPTARSRRAAASRAASSSPARCCSSTWPARSLALRARAARSTLVEVDRGARRGRLRAGRASAGCLRRRRRWTNFLRARHDRARCSRAGRSRCSSVAVGVEVASAADADPRRVPRPGAAARPRR